MTQISTPAKSGASAQTLEFLRQFARQYRPASPRSRGRVSIVWSDDVQPLGEC